MIYNQRVSSVNSPEIRSVGVSYFDFSKECFTTEGLALYIIGMIMIDVAVAGFAEILQSLIFK